MSLAAGGGPLLVGIGLVVGALTTLGLQALRGAPPPTPLADATTGPPATTDDAGATQGPSGTDRAGQAPRNERSPEHWQAWAHDEVARAWRVAAQEGYARAEGRLLAVARDVEGAAGAPEGAREVVRAAQAQLRALAGGEPPPARPASRPPRSPEVALARPPAPRPEGRTTSSPSDPAGADDQGPARDEEVDEEDGAPAWMPRGLDPPAPDDAAPRPPVGVTPEARDLQPTRELLGRLYDMFYRDDTAGARVLLAELERHGEVPETFAARGLFHFKARAYALALDALTRAGDVSLQAVHDRAFAALYLGRLEVVRSLLDHEALARTKLRLLAEGPFRQRYEHAADALEARTDDGHYRVITDLGLTRADLVGLEDKLEGVDAAARLDLIDKARRRHRGLDELSAIMQKAYKAYDKLFGPDRPGDVVPTVVVFSDRAQFDTFSARLEVGSTENTLGYYWPPYRLLVFYDQDEGQRRGGGVVSRATLETLLHETFHQWLDLYVEEAPRWFDEGLAEYFGISELTRTELRFGLVPTNHPSRLDNIREALAGVRARPLPLQRLLTANQQSFMQPAQAGVNYAHAWSFVHYLGASSGGQKVLREYFKALREGLDQEAAYDRVFAPLDLSRLEAEWRQHVGRLR